MQKIAALPVDIGQNWFRSFLNRGFGLQFVEVFVLQAARQDVQAESTTGNTQTENAITIRISDLNDYSGLQLLATCQELGCRS